MTVLPNEVSTWMSHGFDEAAAARAVDLAVNQTGFVMVGNRSVLSKWWNSSGVGAVSVRGMFEGKPALLKVQLVKPTTRESVMMECFASAFRGTGIRPPYVYVTIPANEFMDGEAMVMEDVAQFRLVSSSSFSQDSIGRFIDSYWRYRAGLSGIVPWVEAPLGDAATRITSSFARFRAIRRRLYPEGNWITQKDEDLLDYGISTLEHVYAGVPLVFMHGHFSTRDVYAVKDELVLLSNLYWTWRPPLYDLVFGYHWRRIAITAQSGDAVILENDWWQAAMKRQIGVGEKRWYLAALLERSLATLNLDGASLFKTHPEYLSRIRQEIISLQTQIEAG